MFDNHFSNRITLTNLKTKETVDLDSRRVQIRQNQNGLMAISYVAPFFDIMDLEIFFEDVLSSEKLAINIADTGETKVSYRGIIDGKGKSLPENIDHKIILLQKPTCLDDRENIQLKGFSKFKPRGKIS